MPGTKQGGIKSRDSNLKRNPNHYREIGKKGGLRKVSKGFGKMSKRKRIEAGRKGGSRGGFTIIDDKPFAEGFSTYTIGKQDANQGVIRKWLKR